jgi:hypothetical protein
MLSNTSVSLQLPVCCYQKVIRQGDNQHSPHPAYNSGFPPAFRSMTILLTTLNARYAHASLGLRYLLANMGELQEQTKIHEFVIGARSTDVVEKILAYRQPAKIHRRFWRLYLECGRDYPDRCDSETGGA